MCITFYLQALLALANYVFINQTLAYFLSSFLAATGLMGRAPPKNEGTSVDSIEASSTQIGDIGNQPHEAKSSDEKLSDSEQKILDEKR